LDGCPGHAGRRRDAPRVPAVRPRRRRSSRGSAARGRAASGRGRRRQRGHGRDPRAPHPGLGDPCREPRRRRGPRLLAALRVETGGRRLCGIRDAAGESARRRAAAAELPPRVADRRRGGRGRRLMLALEQLHQDILVGNDAGWALTFHTEDADGYVVETPVTTFSRDDYYGEIQATLPSDLAGGRYQFTIEGLTDEDYAKIAPFTPRNPNGTDPTKDRPDKSTK